MKRMILVFLLSIITSFTLYSQDNIGIFGINRTTDPFEYFLGKLDLENGQISNIDTLPSSFGGFGSQYFPAIDPIGNRYFIISSSKLWTIDLNTGVVLDSLVLDGNNLWFMQYNFLDSAIYGINRTTDPFKYFLGKLDLESGQMINLNTLPSSFGGFGSVYSPAIDPIGNRYFIISSSKLWTIDLKTGVVLDSLVLDGNNLWFMQYNFLDSAIYGINRTTDPFKYFLGKLDLESGQMINLNTLPSSFGGFGSVYSPTIDPIGGKYFIISSSKLWTIDINTGVVLGTLELDGNELWYMQYNYKESITGIKQVKGINTFKIYPNPAKTHVNIKCLGTNIREIKIRLLDIQGHVIRDKYVSSSLERINISNLPKGIYILEIYGSQNLRVEKVIKY